LRGERLTVHLKGGPHQEIPQKLKTFERNDSSEKHPFFMKYSEHSLTKSLKSNKTPQHLVLICPWFVG